MTVALVWSLGCSENRTLARIAEMFDRLTNIAT